MGISRRGALRALVASGVGLGTGTIAYGAAYERLAAIKRAYDPDNFFRSNQNVLAAA